MRSNIQSAKYFSVCLQLFTCILICSAQNSSETYSPVRTNGKVHPKMKGYWKSIGNGYILDATKDSVLLYSYTSNFTYKEKNDYIEGLLNSQARFKRKGNTISILPTDYGTRSDILQIKNDYVRINSLPKGTITFRQMEQLGSKALFDLFIETMQENYAFSKERKLDWKALHKEYGAKITDKTTNDELFKIIGDVVTLSKDHHTKIISASGQTLQYRGTKSGDVTAESFRNQSAIKNQNDYNNMIFVNNALLQYILLH